MSALNHMSRELNLCYFHIKLTFIIINMHFLGFVNQWNINYKYDAICFFLEYNSLFPFHILVFRPNTQFIILFTVDSTFNLLEFRDTSRSNFASKDLVACFSNSCGSDKLSAPVHLWVSNLMCHSRNNSLCHRYGRPLGIWCINSFSLFSSKVFQSEGREEKVRKILLLDLHVLYVR